MTETSCAPSQKYLRVRALLDEAGKAGDMPLSHACRLVLGLENPVFDAQEYGRLCAQGGGGQTRDDEHMIIGMTVVTAREILSDILDDDIGFWPR